MDDIAATEKTRNGKGLAGDTDMSVWSLGASVCFCYLHLNMFHLIDDFSFFIINVIIIICDFGMRLRFSLITFEKKKPNYVVFFAKKIVYCRSVRADIDTPDGLANVIFIR